MTQKIYTETQKFNQWWIWVVILVILVVLCYALIQQVVFDAPFGDKPAPNWALVLLICLLTGLGLLLRRFTLKTNITAEGIQVKYKPFVNKTTLWAQIKSIEVLNYGFVGGWGIRFWTSYGTVYNVRGKMGLAVELKEGKKFLIGTQNAEELEQFLENLPQAQTVLKR